MKTVVIRIDADTEKPKELINNIRKAMAKNIKDNYSLKETVQDKDDNLCGFNQR